MKALQTGLVLCASVGLLFLACQEPEPGGDQDKSKKDTAVVQIPDTTKAKPDTSKAKPDSNVVKPPVDTTPVPVDTSKPPVTDTTKPPVKDTTLTPKPDSAKACNATEWQAGNSYNVGDVVHYAADGKYYKATNANPGYDPVISTWFWSPYACAADTGHGSNPQDTSHVPKDTGGTVTPPAAGFAAVVSEKQFNRMFPNRKAFYTYQGLSEAAATFPTFAAEGDSAARKREAAAFLANVAQETAYLVYVEEITKGDYCGGGDCACAPGKQYYGRGPLQLSWNYNYGAAGAALGQPLCSDPDLVARDAKVAWQTALWFWTTSTGAGSTTCHDEINAGSFGGTIRVINGGWECNGANPAAVANRGEAYKAFCKLLGVDPGSNLGC